MSSQAGGTTLFRVRDVEPATGDCGDLTCEFAGIVTDPSVVAVIIFIGVGALVALTYVRTASEACRREQRRVLNERDAFEEFADRIETLDPIPVESSTAVAGGSSPRHHQIIRSENTIDITVGQVVSIYKETVMSVSHYEEEYNETVPESIAAELGSDTAISLDTNGTLFVPIQRTLVNRAREAVAARTSLADAIETELNALSDADAELIAIDRRRRGLIDHLAEVVNDETGAAIDIWHRLDELEADAEALAIERQHSLHDPPIRANLVKRDTDEMAFYQYLYDGIDTPRHPLLSQIADLTATIREDCARTARRIADGR